MFIEFRNGERKEVDLSEDKDLRYAIFQGLDLSDYDLSGSSLVGANFTDATLSRTNFYGCCG